MDVPSAETQDPTPLTGRDLVLAQDPARVARVWSARGDVRPLLGDLLHRPVERRRHAVAATLEVCTRAEDLLELPLDLPRELATRDAHRSVAREDHRLAVGSLQRGRIRFAPAGGRGHAAQDPVTSGQWRRSRRDDEPALVVALRVAIRVECRRGLREAGEQRRLPDREFREVVDTEVDLGGGGDAVRPVPVEDLVEVRGDDAFLAGFPGVRLVEAEGLDDLLDLPDIAVGPCRNDVLR